MKTPLILLFLWAAIHPTFALDLTLYVNQGVDEDGVWWTSINDDLTFTPGSQFIQMENQDVLNLTLVNTLELPFTFVIQGFGEYPIGALETALFTLENLSSNRSYRYFIEEESMAYTGASGLIVVGFDPTHAFYWNLFDVNAALSEALFNGTSTAYPAEYEPEFFYINGNKYPDTLEDPYANVMGSLGDTLYIHVVNSGYMDHVMHFHGFHVTILTADIQSERVGWSKDTVPVKRGEVMTFQLVANQVGMYPIHDHNLIAVTTAGLYPGGMITHIHITE